MAGDLLGWGAIVAPPPPRRHRRESPLTCSVVSALRWWRRDGQRRHTVTGGQEPACLVIADISGYTGYLAGVELDHAQDILLDLVSTVVASLRPMLRLAKLEGDAAFAYVVTPTIDGSTLQETVEGTYFAFQRRLR